jgi:ADP-ribose pyrophosphatase YjhB (NUDIX family)
MPEKMPLKKFREIYSQVPRLCVEVVIKTDDGVVLTKRAIEPYKGKWHIPGGTVLFGEMLNDAVKRVAREEAGVEVEVGKILGYIEYPDEAQVRGYGWAVGIAFQARVTGGKLMGSQQGEEIKTFVELPEDMIWEQKDFLKNK